MQKIKIVHFLNQFFAGVGGEDKAYSSPEIRKGAVGPGIALEQKFQENARVVGTVLCGDNYFAENPEQSVQEVLELIQEFEPNVVVAGPAFGSG